tara:strand:- start:72 stop:692 length:621 start_codon:yes stop_codon:yes gene_type:complete
MSFLFLGFITGLSLILAIGPQNIFVIEQGLKKQYIFLVCLICSISDMFLIFIGIIIFDLFVVFLSNDIFLIILNILLLFFLFHFIWKKWNEQIDSVNLNYKNFQYSLKIILFRTLGFTYLNPHVYSDTVFFLGNFSKNFNYIQKVYFGLGASFCSFIFFFSLGYLARFFSNYLNAKRTWKTINKIIIFFMLWIVYLVFNELLKYIF